MTCETEINKYIPFVLNVYEFYLAVNIAASFYYV